jgi:hypothetical protein
MAAIFGGNSAADLWLNAMVAYVQNAAQAQALLQTLQTGGTVGQGLCGQTITVSLDYNGSIQAAGFDWTPVQVSNALSTVNVPSDFGASLAPSFEWNAVTILNTVATVNVATDYP